MFFVCSSLFELSVKFSNVGVILERTTSIERLTVYKRVASL